MRNEAVITGVGIHPFGRFNDKSAEELGQYAVDMALADANIEFKDVQAMFLSNSGSIYPGIGPKVAFMFGRTTIPIVNVEAACSGGGACLRMAQMAIGKGNTTLFLPWELRSSPGAS